MTHNPQSVGPDMKVSDAVLIMIERGFRHCHRVPAANLGCSRCAMPYPGDWRCSEPGRVHDQVNDALDEGPVQSGGAQAACPVLWQVLGNSRPELICQVFVGSCLYKCEII